MEVDAEARGSGVGRPLAPAVAEALQAQNARWGAAAPSRARDAHLAALRRGTAAVVTGQQVGLFLGPLYTVYKAATAVRVAREMGPDVVPVFWLQTEDHDLPEIASVAVPDAHGQPQAIALPAAAESRVSIAHLGLPAGVERALAEVEAAGAGEAHAARLRRHYRPGARWCDAFAGVVAELFAPEGLVLVDPRDPALAAAAAGVHARALGDAEGIAAELVARAEALGDGAPVHVRPGAPLSFFHPDGATGRRLRLEPAADDGDRFHEVGAPDRSHTRAELAAALERDPMAFSTSALLRPIVQDALLPTAAYVGGPAEVKYFAQLEPLYARFAMAMPRILPRARFRVIDARARRLLDRLGVSPDEACALADAALVARGRDAATAKDALPPPAELARRLLPPFEEAHARLAPELAAAGPGMPRALAKTRQAVARSIAKLTAKYERALLVRDRALAEDVARLRGLLLPGGVPQERVYGLAAFAARAGGDRAFVEKVLAAVVPGDATLRDLELAS